MNYIIVALAAYFFLALSQVMDKFFLSDRIPKPSVYAFFMAVLSFSTIALAPFGFYFKNYLSLSSSLVSGALYIYAIIFLYKAVKVNEVSRIASLVGSIIVLANLFADVFLTERQLTISDFGGVCFLLAGGFLISFDLPIKSARVFRGFGNALVSGILFAISYVIFKYVYQNDIFINGFIWTRMGLFAGGLSLLFFSVWRKEIFASFKEMKKNKKRNLATGAMFVGNKILGGSHSVLFQYAIYLGSVTVVNALNSVHFVFVLVLAGAASLKYPKLFGEKLSFWDWAQKIAAIALIGMGIVLVSI